jgi:phosphatidylglycerophosphate synthase
MQGHWRGELRRLPNVLSLSRVLLAVLFVPAGRGGRIALVCLAGATDFLDGWVARRTHTTTRWGALVDPIADRLFVLVAIVTYVLNGELSVGESLLLLSRDIATALAFSSPARCRVCARSSSKLDFPERSSPCFNS